MQVKLYVSKLTSTKTQIPYEYYSLPFCRPNIHAVQENIGQVLSGDRIENSVYKVDLLGHAMQTDDGLTVLTCLCDS